MATNEIFPELLSVSAMNPFHQHLSSSRAHMFSSHLGQMLVTKGSDVKTIQSGVEREFGKYTFKVKMPCNGQIIDVIEKYRQGLGQNTISENPETIAIYEDIDTKQIGCIRLPNYCVNHQYFGFEYKRKEGLKKISQGAFIPKDTVFLDSPSITNEGDYKYGVQANVAYMTHPATSEDGILISSDFLPKLGFKTYETRVVEWGTKKYALNLYGDINNYKPFPDIGTRIRPDGLLMALRDYDPIELAIVERGVDDTMNVDFTFDTTMYANGPGGKIVDIIIHHDINNNNHADIHMDEQAQHYDEQRRIYYKRILDVWKRLHKTREGVGKQNDGALQLTPDFHRLVLEAQSVVSEVTGQKVIKLHRQEALDNFRVEFKIEYDYIPSTGFKLTDTSGKNL